MTQGSVEVQAAAEPASQAEAQPTTPAEPKPIDPLAEFRGKKIKQKVDGQELEVDLEEIIKAYPKISAADKRFMEAASIRKQVDGLLKNITEAQDYQSLVKLMGKEKAEKFAEDLLLEKINYEQMSPEQRRAFELEQENKTLKSREEEAKRARLEQERAAIRAQAVQSIDTEISAALKELGKKPTPRLIARIAEQMLVSLEAGEEGLDEMGNPIPRKRMPARDAMTRTLSEFQAELREYIDGLSVEEARKVLPKTLLDGLRKADIDKVITPFHSRSVKPSEEKPKSTNKKHNKMRSEDWFAAMESKFR